MSRQTARLLLLSVLVLAGSPSFAASPSPDASPTAGTSGAIASAAPSAAPAESAPPAASTEAAASSSPEATPSPEASPKPSAKARVAPVALPTPSASASPQPYGEDEFPQWARDLRRFEIVSIGSLPFTMLYSGMGYDLYRYFSGKNPVTGESLSLSARDAKLLPWPLKSAYSYQPTRDENIRTILTAGAASLGVGAIDLAIVSIKRIAERQEALRVEARARKAAGSAGAEVRISREGEASPEAAVSPRPSASPAATP